MNGPAIFAYSVNYLIDTDNAVIVNVEASRSVRQAEVGANGPWWTGRRTPSRCNRNVWQLTRPMATARCWPGSMTARSARIFRSSTDRPRRWHIPEHGLQLRSCSGRIHLPWWNKLKKYWRTMSNPRSGTGADGFRKYYASKKDCGACALKALCTPNQETRKISRHPHEAVRDKVPAMAGTDAFLESSRRRKKVEMLFSHLKRILGLERLRLRGPNGARDEFHLAATAQNLRKLAKLTVDAPSPA